MDARESEQIAFTAVLVFVLRINTTRTALASRGELKVSARERERTREYALVSFDGRPPPPLSLGRSLSLLSSSLSLLSVIQHEGHHIAVQSEHAAPLSIAPPVGVTHTQRYDTTRQHTEKQIHTCTVRIRSNRLFDYFRFVFLQFISTINRFCSH